jgi:hypothetical protein
MATKVRVEHAINCSEDTYWNQLFFDEEYNRRLNGEALKFSSFQVVRKVDEGDTIVRVMDMVPRIGDLPMALKKVIGENAGYREEARFDKNRKRYAMKVIPNKLADKVRVEGELYTESTGEKSCRRIATAEINASIFGVGGMLERKIAEDLEKAYGIAARFTNEFIKEKGL